MDKLSQIKVVKRSTGSLGQRSITIICSAIHIDTPICSEPQ